MTVHDRHEKERIQLDEEEGSILDAVAERTGKHNHTFGLIQAIMQVAKQIMLLRQAIEQKD